MRTRDQRRGRATAATLLESSVAGSVVGILLFVYSIYALGEYGFIVFVAGPLMMGLVAGYALGSAGSYNAMSRMTVGVLSIVFCALALLALAFEGVICLAMSAPVAIPLNLVGVWIGSSMGEPRHRMSFTWIIVLLLPLALGADHSRDAFPIRPIVTTLEIDAPMDTVWSHVVGFERLPEPTEPMFRIGIAHPIGARIEGTGIDAVRYCEFSTGPFVEPITAWDPPRRLAFDVSDQPDPMHEWSPYRQVNAPHLAHGLKSYRGEFQLSELPGGRTLLQGTTWYQVRMSPHVYWRAWSDWLIGGIHRRVLNHVKQLSEEEGNG